MPRELELFDGTLLEFPDDATDDVMLAAGRRETQRLRDAQARQPLPRDVTPSPGGRGSQGATAEQAVQRAPLPSSMQRIADVDRGIRQAAQSRDAQLGLNGGAGRGFVEPPLAEDYGNVDGRGVAIAPQEAQRQRQSDNWNEGVVPVRQLGRDVLGGVENVKGIARGAAAYPASLSFGAFGRALTDMDAVDATGDVLPRPRTDPNWRASIHPYADSYLRGDEAQRRAIRERVVQAASQDAEVLAAAQAKIAEYQAEAQKLTGKVPEFTDIQSATGFYNWLTRNAAVGGPSMAAAMVGALFGPPGLAITSAATAVGDLTQERLTHAGTVTDPKRFTSADRAAEAAAARPGLIAQHVSDNAAATALLAPIYAAGDTALGPAARLAGSVGRPAAQTVGQAIGNAVRGAPRQVVEEFIGEGPVQESVNIAGQMIAGERGSDITGEDAKRVFNAGMAGAAAAPLGQAANAAIDSARVLIRPTEQRKAIGDRLDDLAAEHGISPKVVKAIKEQAERRPLSDAVPYMKRAIAALRGRGVVGQHVTDEALGALDEQPQQSATTQVVERGTSDAIGAAELLDDGSGLADPPPRSAIDDGASQAATSPSNDRPEPTEAQKAAGNYKKGPFRLAGMPGKIENEDGTTRRGVDPDGTPWESQTVGHYGYLNGTEGADGDHFDVGIKPGTPADYNGPVFVIDQIDPKTGKFDEHKGRVGYATEDEARASYLANYPDGWRGLGAITQMPMAAFRSWVKDGKKRKPLGDLTNATAAGAGRDGIAGPADAQRGNGSELLRGQPRNVADDARGADESTVLGVQPDAVRPAQLAERNDALNAGAQGAEGVSPGLVEAAPVAPAPNADQPPANPVAESLAPGRSADGDGAVARAQGAGGRILTRAGRAPNAATDIELRANADGTLTPHMEGSALLNFETAQPIVLPADVSDIDAKKAIRAAGAVSNKTNFYPAKGGKGAEAASPVSAAPKVPAPTAPASAATTKEKSDEGQEGLQGRRQEEVAASAGGKAPPAAPRVFKTRDGANKAKRESGNAHKVQAVKGGFILREMTDKERAAARRLGQKGARPTVDPAKDTLLTAIAKLGGINRESARADLGVHADDFKARGASILPVFPANGGMTAEHALEALAEYDYLLRDASLHDLEGKLASAIGGGAEFSMRHEYEAEPEPLADFTPDELDDAGYTADSPEAQALTEELLSAAEALGIDIEALREDAARTTEGQSHDAYHAEARRLAQEAIAATRPGAAGGDAEGSRSSDQDGGQTAGDQGQEEGLTAPTRESLQEAEDRAAAADKADRAEQKRLADKARADAERDEFTLTGSDRAADVAAAAGQRGMFDEPAPTADARQLGREAGQRGDPRDPPQDLSNTDRQLWRAGWDQSKQTKVTPQVPPRAPRTADDARLIALRKRESVLRSLKECLTNG